MDWLTIIVLSFSALCIINSSLLLKAHRRIDILEGRLMMRGILPTKVDEENEV